MSYSESGLLLVALSPLNIAFQNIFLHSTNTIAGGMFLMPGLSLLHQNLVNSLLKMQSRDEEERGQGQDLGLEIFGKTHH